MLWKKVKGNKNEDREQNICKEKLIEIITSVINGQAIYVNEEEIECKEIADLWNKMLDSLCEEKRKSVMKINDLLQFITEMEFIKDMINDGRNQTNIFHNIAASSEEMSTSIDDVANFVQNVSDVTNDTQQVAAEGGENINNAFSFVNQSFEDIDAINNQMQNLMGKADKINKIVDIVKGIADQTNLLALNAAIEAARAGDAGKGFAVVADEVRKLAEHTKESVDDIQQNINELKNDIEKSVARANETSSKFDSGKGLVDNALNSMDTIIDRIRGVNNSIMQISANVEEQTATTSEITREITNLSGLTDNLLNECDRTGRAIFDVSKIVNDLRLNIINNGLCFEDKELLEICIADHLIWKWRVYNMILGYDRIDINSIGTHKDCRLGKWYYGEDSKLYKNDRNFIALEEDHIKLHELAKEAAVAYSKNNVDRAERALEEMGKCSEQVIKGLRGLKNK